MSGGAIDAPGADATWRDRREPAMQMLLACLAPAGATTASTAALQDDDWTRLLALTQRHRVPGLAWRGLQHIGARAAPAKVHTEMEQRAQANVARSLMLLRETLLLMDAFHRAGIPSLVLKGPLLSQQLYDDPGLRQSNDIDLLIDPTQFERAQTIVFEAGYLREEPDRQLDQLRWRIYLRASHHARYQRPRGPVLELHWRLHPLAHLHPADVHALLARSETIHMGGQPVPVLQPPEQFLYLAGHGARHEWRRLKWACDLPPLLARMDARQRQTLRARAAELGLQRPCAQALQLCALLFEADIPRDLDTAARPDSATRAMIRRAQAALLAPESDGPAGTRTVRSYTAALRRHLRLNTRLRYKLECLGEVLSSPADIDTMPLPPALGFLYVFLRPLFWVRRRIRGL